MSLNVRKHSLHLCVGAKSELLLELSLFDGLLLGGDIMRIFSYFLRGSSIGTFLFM
jgi:hypothetical protein